MLVGNKCDQGQVQVPTGVAQRWADDRNMPLFETSAMVRTCVLCNVYVLCSIASLICRPKTNDLNEKGLKNVSIEKLYFTVQ